MDMLEIKNLRVKKGGTEIIRGLDLRVRAGEKHVIMGPNGSGKSTLCLAVMGHPQYKVCGGDILFNGKSIVGLSPDRRARLGLFLGFQYPVEVSGVHFGNFLRQAVNSGADGRNKRSGRVDPRMFHGNLAKAAARLGMDKRLIGRSLNEDFSGGEKKRAEILQMAMLKPKIAILDEIDSGLDIDALKKAAAGIEAAGAKRMGLLLVTHYQRILDHLKPDFVHVMDKGTIVKSGGRGLAKRLEKEGYGNISLKR